MKNNSKGKIKVVNSAFLSSDESLFEDDLHLNMVGTNRLIQEIGKHVDGLIRRTPSVQVTKYAKVSTEYPWGCQNCTNTMHKEENGRVKKNAKKRNSGHLLSPENGQDRQKARTK